MLKADAQTDRRMPVTLVTAATLTGAAFAVWMGAIRAGNGNAVLHEVSGHPLDSLALAAIFAAPVMIGLLGLWRPALLLAAGVSCALLAFTPLIVTFVLVLPGVLFLVAFSRSDTGLAARDVLAIVATVVFSLAGPVMFLVGSNETVCWTEIDRPDGTTDLVRNAGEEADMADGSATSELGVPVEGGVASGGGCTTGAITRQTSVNILITGLSSIVAGWLIASPRREVAA